MPLKDQGTKTPLETCTTQRQGLNLTWEPVPNLLACLHYKVQIPTSNLIP